MQKMILVCGLPGSGKTTFARRLAKEIGFDHIDIDEVYAKVNGDSKNRANKFEVWQEFFRLIHESQQAGHSVIVDTMALTAYNRREFVEWFPEFKEHHLVFIDAEYDTCLNNVSSRDRTIPAGVLWRYFNNIEWPRRESDWKWDRISWFCNDGAQVKFVKEVIVNV